MHLSSDTPIFVLLKPWYPVVLYCLSLIIYLKQWSKCETFSHLVDRPISAANSDNKHIAFSLKVIVRLMVRFVTAPPALLIITPFLSRQDKNVPY